MNSKPQSGKPVQIVSLNQEKSKFVFNKEAALGILCSPEVAHRKVVCVSVAGAFRQGKSFILNCLIHLLERYKKYQYLLGSSNWLREDTGTLKGFAWRSGSKRETTGIWMWSEPFIIKLATGDEAAVLLFDTQGLFDHKSTITDNTCIFALSLILSSVQIYNLFANISEDRLEILQYFMEFARYATGEASSAPFQHLMFLVRDWSNPHEKPYGFGGGALYLQDVLEITAGQKKENKTVRKRLRQSFEKITCLLTPRPGDIVVTSDTFTGSLADIPRGFKIQLANLSNCLFSPQSATVKTVHGRPINGKQLFDIFESSFNVFLSGQLPEAKTAFQSLAEQTNSAAVRRGTLFYNKRMEAACDGNAPLHETDFNKAHQNISLKARQVFDQSPKLGDKEIGRRFAFVLEKEIMKLHNTFLKSNMLKWDNKRKEEKLTEEQRKKKEAEAKAEEERLRRLHQETLAAAAKRQFEFEQNQKEGELADERRRRVEATQQHQQYQQAFPLRDKSV